MVLYLSIQLRCRNKNKTKMFNKRQTHKNWYFFYIFIFLSWRVIEPNVHTPLSIIIRKLATKRDTFYVKWQPEVSDDEKHLKIRSQLTERAKLQFKTFNLQNNWNYLPLN